MGALGEPRRTSAASETSIRPLFAASIRGSKLDTWPNNPPAYEGGLHEESEVAMADISKIKSLLDWKLLNGSHEWPGPDGGTSNAVNEPREEGSGPGGALVAGDTVDDQLGFNDVAVYRLVGGTYEWYDSTESDEAGNYQVRGLAGGTYRLEFYDWW